MKDAAYQPITHVERLSNGGNATQNFDSAY